MKIKNNIWKKDTSNGALFIKKYENESVAEKVKLIHNLLNKIDFPYVIPMVKTREKNVFVQRWQHNSMSADFSIKEQRLQAAQILNALHETGNVIEWNKYVVIPRQDLFYKWNRRLERFLLYENEFIPYLEHNFFEISLFAKRVLRKMKREKQTKNSLTLLHGDVVHHNFLICEEGMKLIDFDLAVIGDPAEEMILWMHRVLPTVNYDLELLLHEMPFLYDLCFPKLHYLQYPNELLREWLYTIHLNEMEKEAFFEYLIPFTEEAIAHWPDLIAQIEAIQSTS